MPLAEKDPPNSLIILILFSFISSLYLEETKKCWEKINKKHQVQNAAIEMANEIFSNGRIVDLGDWGEIRAEMEHEMDNQTIPEDEQEIMLNTIKTYLY